MNYANSEKMTFGQHKDTLIIEVPNSYFEWLDSQPDFRRILRRYMKSTYYQRLV